MPLAACNELERNVGRATASATTEICGVSESNTRAEEKGESYHVESLVCVFLCSLAAGAVDTNPFAIVHRCFEDTINGRVQVVVERAQDRTADVVSKIPRADEQDVNAGHLGDFLDLLVQHLFISIELGTYIIKRLLGFDLNHRDKRVIGRLQIFYRRHITRGTHGERTPKPSSSNGGELGRLDEFARIVRSIDKRHQDPMGPSIQSSYTGQHCPSAICHLPSTTAKMQTYA